jgi:hypothetical protein
MLASRLSSHDLQQSTPNAKQRALLQSALYMWMAVSEDQLMSQLLLQLLLLAYCIPSSAELTAGSPEACTFVSKVVSATSRTANCSPGELVFAEVQLSFVLTSALLSASPCLCMCVRLLTICALQETCAC